jgi:F-type H+-transporting ATPase subunit delta
VAEPGSLSPRIEELFARARGDEGALEQVPDEILSFAGVLRTAPALRALLADVTVPVEGKLGVLEDLLAEKAHPVTLEVLEEVVRQGMAARALLRTLEDLGLAAYLAAAEQRGSLPNVEDELFRFAHVLGGSNELTAALTDPARPIEAKHALLEDLLAEKADPATRRILEAIVVQNLPGDLRAQVMAVAEEAARRRSRVVVEARTAVPIEESRRERLAAALAKVTGKEIDLKVSVDPRIRGGVVARVEDEVFDGSVRRKLALALERLTA